MPSQARNKFCVALARASLLASQAGKLRAKRDVAAKTVFLHACLASQVAAWDAYVKALVDESFIATADPTNVRFSAVHTLCYQVMTQAREKLNTPNSENTRNFLMAYTSFDPWGAWVGIRFGKTLLSSSLNARERLNEIFKVRHSFAHGYTMPAFAWNTDTLGSAFLSCQIVASTGRFFDDLVKKTDAAMSSHISMQHGLPSPW